VQRCPGQYAAPPCETSLLHNIAEEYSRTDFGDSELLVRDSRGFDEIARHLRVGLEASAPSCVLLRHVVSEVDCSAAGGVCVRACGPGGSESFRARAALITVSMGVLQAGRIAFRPALPFSLLRDVHAVRSEALTFQTHTAPIVYPPGQARPVARHHPIPPPPVHGSGELLQGVRGMGGAMVAGSIVVRRATVG
jgi:hypothetical protein